MKRICLIEAVRSITFIITLQIVWGSRQKKRNIPVQKIITFFPR